MGWFEEDPANNPEDPTVGALFFRVPAADGSFGGLMPFAYQGCSPGVDVGNIAGNRSADALAGHWQGTLDGQAVGGSWSANQAAAAGRFDGSFDNSGGKQPIVVGSCSYFMAAQGRLRVFDRPSSEPAGVALNFSDTSTTPSVGWQGVPAGATTALRVFDEACLEGSAASAACYLGGSFSTGTSLAYPAGFAAAHSLAIGGRYLFVLTAQTAPTGPGAGIAAYASTRFTPTVTGSSGGSAGTGGGGDGGIGSAHGQLTLSGTLGNIRFSPGTVSLPDTDGPRCTSAGSLTICSSSWTTQWLQSGDPLRNPLIGTFLVSVGSSSLTAPGPGPGSSLDLLTLQYHDAASATIFRFSCGVTPTAPCTGATAGITLDLQARTVRFEDRVLPASPPFSGSITINGTLSY